MWSHYGKCADFQYPSWVQKTHHGPSKPRTLEEAIIPPNTSMAIPTVSNKELPENTDLLISDVDDNIKKDDKEDGKLIKHIETINMITKVSDDKRYRVVLVNNTDNYLRFAKNEEIATITPSSVYNKHMTLRPFLEENDPGGMDEDPQRMTNDQDEDL